MNNDHIKVFKDYLEQLSCFLEKIEVCEEGGTAILEARLANGIPASKGDFDGFHKYPSGFTFE